jgi:phage gp29-like protein
VKERKRPKPGATLTGATSVDQLVRRLEKYREQYNPLLGLSISRARTLIESFTRGDFADLMWTFGAPFMGIESADANVRALIERRVSPLLEMDWTIKVTSQERKTSTPGFESKVKAQESLAWELMEGIQNLYEAIEHLAMAAFRGFSHCEIERDGSGKITRFIVMEQWNVVRDGIKGAWKYNPTAQSVSFSSLPEEYLIDPQNFLIDERKRPIHRVALVNFILRQMAMKDWSAFVEIYGVPGGVVIGPPNVPAEREAEYERAASELVDGGRGYLPNGSDYKVNSVPAGENPFASYIKTLSEEIVLAGTGGKLTMLTESGSGTLAGTAHTETFEKIVKGEARKISEVIQRQIIAPALKERFPQDPELVYFELSANEETNVSEFVQDVATLSSAGFVVEPEQVTEKTGYRVAIKEPVSGSPSLPVVNRVTSKDEADFKKTVAQAQAKALDPIRSRIEEILALDDAEEIHNVAGRLKASLPSFLKESNVSPETARVYEEILGSVLAEALVEGGRP